MPKHFHIQDPSQEIGLLQRRIIIMGAILLVIMGIIIVRLSILQLVQHHRYTTLSEQNQLNLVPLAPNRGLIYDRNGVLLAENLPVFSLEIIPDKVHDLPNTIQALTDLVTLSDEDIQQFYKQLKQQHRFDAIPLKLQLTPGEAARFAVNQYRFPGVIVNARLLRNYPLGQAMVNVLGYVGRINAHELQQIDNSNYRTTHYIGKLGIEKFYEPQLHGQAGYERAETDANGRTVRILDRTAPIPGNNLYLTIDSRLQIAAHMALGQHRGAVVAIQPATGQILALASHPAYNPNLFVTGISQRDYDGLRHSPDQPLFNRAIRGQYPPGSLVKPIYALKGLANHTITPRSRMYDKGWYQLPNSSHRFRGWNPRGLGWLNVTSAIEQSSDPFFYDLARKMGIETMQTILHDFGFGKLTEIDMGEERAGIVPGPAWKRANKGKGWYPGDTIITGIGQGSLLVTPLQMASATATLAMHGKRFTPYLVLKQQTSNLQDNYTTPIAKETIILPDKVWQVVIHAMRKVITGAQGTGFRFGKPRYTVAAKTGTSQLFTVKQNEKYADLNVPERLRDHSTFIAFAPIKQPEIAIAVIVENDPSAPNVARKVMDNYFKYVKQPQGTT